VTDQNLGFKIFDFSFFFVEFPKFSAILPLHFFPFGCHSPAFSTPLHSQGVRAVGGGEQANGKKTINAEAPAMQSSLDEGVQDLEAKIVLRYLGKINDASSFFFSFFF